jgi:UDP-N-acetylmuramate dehydrogenase
MEKLKIRGELAQNELLSKHTSYGIGGPADVFASPVDRDDLLALLRAIKLHGLKYFVLGAGTNLLVRDGGFRGVVISLKRLDKITIEREYRSIGGSFGVVYVEAGVPLAKLVAFGMEEGFTGLEFGAGIPGTVGGAVCMNAGTAAGEIGDIIDSVTLLTPDGELVTKTGEEMDFGYRTSSIEEGYLVVDTRIILRRDDKNKIKARVKEIVDARKHRQPAGLPNAGSMFKNPQEESAGKLIEAAGLKGKIVGGAQISDKHANFIVNKGKATAADVLALMEMVKDKVLEVHRVRLEPEIKIIGED